ncbi:MAG: formylmethanofuran dehydrogenase subunit A [Planctomycetota bacterium]
MSRIKLQAGIIYDPANSVSGTVGDIWIEDGKIVGPPNSERESDFWIIDVRDRVVMPGGIDMHCHCAGPKVNTARKMQPEFSRAGAESRIHRNGLTLHSGNPNNVPTIFTTGYRYTGMGYTTCFDAAVSPLASRHVHREFEQIPNVDTGFYTLVGNNQFVLEQIAAGDTNGLDHFLAWLFHKTAAFAPKIVNPGGVENFKNNREGNIKDLHQKIDGFGITPAQIVESIARSANRLNLPHPVHIHCNNLGMPGNWTTTLETMKTLEGQKAHLAHIQFHSYGGGDEVEESLCSKVDPLANYVNENPNLSVDVGQVMFGQTTSMTGDSALGYYLQKIGGKRWASADTECESGCGISPIEFKNKKLIHALQWAIGLEWYLKIKNPWQIVMSTDHPNGGSFLAYPQIVRLLMDSNYRREMIKKVHPEVLQATELESIDREYTLEEIAIITRAGPAKLLGLRSKGHLGPGADADITVYNPSKNYEQMFSLPWMVIKSGQLLIEDSEIRNTVSGVTFAVQRPWDTDFSPKIHQWFGDNYSISSCHFGVREGEFDRIVRL